MKNLRIVSIVATIIIFAATTVFVGCKKEETKTDKEVMNQVVKQRKSESVEPINPSSTFFISENGPGGPFHDEFGNSVEMGPIYEEPVGIGRLFSDGHGGYRVECEINPNGTTCGTVWVDINGVDQKGVYWCTPDREKYIIDLSWHLN